jgi:WD40 repeat protein
MRLLSVTGTATVECLAFSPDGTRLAAACQKANARVWGLVPSTPPLNLKGTKDSRFVGFTAGPDGLVVSSWNTPPAVWDLRAMTSRRLGPEPGYCYDTALSPDGTRLARVERQVSCRDAVTGRTLWEVTWNHESGLHPQVCYNADGSRLFVVGKHVGVLDAETGAELSGFDLTFRRYAILYRAAVSPDGRWLATRGAEGMQVRDTADGRVALEEVEVGYGRALAFTPDGLRLAAYPSNGAPRIDFWHVGSWRRGPSLDFGIGSVTSLAFSANGQLGAAGGYHGQVVVWDEG